MGWAAGRSIMRLLRKTITTYFIYSAILLLFAIPAFYFALKKIMVSIIDESLLSTKTLIIPQLQNNIIKHLEKQHELFRVRIHYEKEQPDQSADSIYTIQQ